MSFLLPIIIGLSITASTFTQQTTPPPAPAADEATLQGITPEADADPLQCMAPCSSDDAQCPC